MSKKNITNRVMTVVSSVSSNRGKPELETCNRKKRGFKVNFFLIGVILALLPLVRSASDRGVIVRDSYGNKKQKTGMGMTRRCVTGLKTLSEQKNMTDMVKNHTGQRRKYNRDERQRTINRRVRFSWITNALRLHVGCRVSSTFFSLLCSKRQNVWEMDIVTRIRLKGTVMGQNSLKLKGSSHRRTTISK